MFVHWSKQINIEQLGRRIIRVECTHCHCEYYYTLIRIGVGTGTAHYSLGVERATRSAQKQATEELNRRLGSDAELVPCPECSWVNEELVEGYRRGLCRSAGGYAVFLAFLGGALLLGAGWIYFAGARLAHSTLFNLLCGGTVLCWLIALATIGVRNWVRSRIQPNHNFPEPPQLPPGTPTALVRDRKSGEFVPAVSRVPVGESTNGWIDFRIGHDVLPKLCCDCLQDSVPGQGHTAKLTKTLQTEIPRCSFWPQVTRRVYSLTLLYVLLGGLLTAGALALTLKLRNVDLWVMVIFATVAVIWLAFFLASQFTRPVRVQIHDRSRGVVRMRFRNAAYASMVADHLKSF